MSFYLSWRNVGRKVSEVVSEWPIMKSELSETCLLSMTFLDLSFYIFDPSFWNTSIMNLIVFFSKACGPFKSDDSIVLLPLPVLPMTSTTLASRIFSSALNPSPKTSLIDSRDSSLWMTFDFLRMSVLTAAASYIFDINFKLINYKLKSF